MTDAVISARLQQRIDTAKAHMLHHGTLVPVAGLPLEKHELLSLDVTGLADEPRQLIAHCRRIAVYQSGKSRAMQEQLTALLHPAVVNNTDAQEVIQTVDNLERAIKSTDALIDMVFAELQNLTRLAISYTGENWKSADQDPECPDTKPEEDSSFCHIVNESISKEQIAHQAMTRRHLSELIKCGHQNIMETSVLMLAIDDSNLKNALREQRDHFGLTVKELQASLREHLRERSPMSQMNDR